MGRIKLAIILFIFSLVIRLYGGLLNNPPFVQGDELQVVEWTRGTRLGEFSTWQGRMDAAVERFMLVPVRATQVIFGDNLAGSRMAHVVIGSLTVSAMFFFAAPFIGDFAATVAAFMFSVNHVHVYFSRNLSAAATQSTLAYALAVAFGLAGRHNPLCWVFAGAAAGWGARTYPMGWLILPLLLATLVLWRKDFEIKRFLLMLLTIFTTFLLSCGDWLLWMIKSYPFTVRHVAQQQIDTSEGLLRHTYLSFMAFWTTLDNGGNYASRMVAVDTITGCLFIAGIIFAILKWRTRPAQFFLIWFPPLLSFVVFSTKGIGYYRLMPAIMCACYVSSWALCEFLPKLTGLKISKVFIIFIMASITYLNLQYALVQFPADTGNSEIAKGLRVIEKLCNNGKVSQEDIVWFKDGYFLRLLRVQCPDKAGELELVIKNISPA